MAKLRSDLSKIAARMPKLAAAVRTQTAADVLSVAKQLAPVDTGELRDSGATEEKNSDTTLVGFTAEHAPPQEFGTYKMAAQPFLIPAMAQSESTFRARAAQALKELG